MAMQTVGELIEVERTEFYRVYLGGIPGPLTEDGALLSFVAVLTGTEALAGFVAASLSNGERFRQFRGFKALARFWS